MKDVKEMKLELATKKLFGDLEIKCYVDTSVENGNFFMTRRQIGEALEYKTEKQMNVLIFRHKDDIGNSVGFKLKSTDGKFYNTELYSFEQLFQILRFSKQPKATGFMNWSAFTLKELVTNRAELKFKTQTDEDTYKAIIAELEDKAEAYNQILVAPNSQHMNIIAKTLGWGRNKLFAFLREQKILMKDNTPYQRYIKAGYFSVREQVIQTGDTVPVTYISGRGLDYIRKRLKKANANI